MGKLPNPRDQEAIRYYLHHDTGRDITDETIALLEADGTLPAYRNTPGRESWDKLRTAARRHTRGTPGRKEGRKPITTGPILTSQEQERANVRSRSLARLAARWPSVVNLRRALFGGRLLSPLEADTWLAQRAIRYFSKKWFDNNGIPLLGHTAELNDPRTGEQIRWVADDVQNCVFQIRWSGGTLEVPLCDVYDDDPATRVNVKIGRGNMHARLGSVLSDMQRVAADLAHHYGWREGDAFVFLITGRPPLTPAIWFRHVIRYRDDHAHVYIEFEVEPWVSIGSVRKAYASLQERMRYKQSYTRGERSFPIFEFVEERRDRMRAESEGVEAASMVDFDWEEAADEWNRAQGDRLDASSLKERYESARFTILRPPYTGPRSAGSDMGGEEGA